jgi:hypothetical protein
LRLLPNAHDLFIPLFLTTLGSRFSTMSFNHHICLPSLTLHLFDHYLTRQVENGETAAAAARRELREEMRVESAHWRPLGAFRTDVVGSECSCDVHL